MNLLEFSIANQKCEAADDANGDDAADDGAAGVMIPMCHHCLAGDAEINSRCWCRTAVERKSKVPPRFYEMVPFLFLLFKLLARIVQIQMSIASILSLTRSVIVKRPSVFAQLDTPKNLQFARVSTLYIGKLINLSVTRC